MKTWLKSAVLLALPVALLLVGVTVMLAQVMEVAAQDGEDASTGPSGLAVAVENGMLALTWTPGANADYTGQWLKIWPEDDSDNWHAALVAVDVSGGSYPVGTLQPETAYSFQIAGAVAGEDGRIAQEGYSNVVTVTIPAVSKTVEEGESEVAEGEGEDTTDPDDGKSKRPTDLVAAPGENGSVNLTWTPGKHRREVAQVVRRRVAEIVPAVWTDVEVAVDATSYTDDTVGPGVPYIYRVTIKRNNDKLGPVSNRATIIGPGARDNRTPKITFFFLYGLEEPSPDATSDVGRVLVLWSKATHPRYINSFQTLHVASSDGSFTNQYQGGAFIDGFEISLKAGQVYRFWVTVPRDDDRSVKSSVMEEAFVFYPDPDD